MPVYWHLPSHDPVPHHLHSPPDLSPTLQNLQTPRSHLSAPCLLNRVLAKPSSKTRSLTYACRAQNLAQRLDRQALAPFKSSAKMWPLRLSQSAAVQVCSALSSSAPYRVCSQCHPLQFPTLPAASVSTLVPVHPFPKPHAPMQSHYWIGLEWTLMIAKVLVVELTSRFPSLMAKLVPTISSKTLPTLPTCPSCP